VLFRGVSTHFDFVSQEHYPGISQSAFAAEIAEVLLAPLNPKDIEVISFLLVVLFRSNMFCRSSRMEFSFSLKSSIAAFSTV
jgi:hypothetical protein